MQLFAIKNISNVKHTLETRNHFLVLSLRKVLITFPVFEIS